MLLGHTRAQDVELETRRKEIAERKVGPARNSQSTVSLQRREREMQEELERQEGTVNEFQSTFSSLRQEVIMMADDRDRTMKLSGGSEAATPEEALHQAAKGACW